MDRKAPEEEGDGSDLVARLVVTGTCDHMAIMRLPLPSELSQGQGDDPVVVAHPSPVHLERSSEALSRVAATVGAATAASPSLRSLDIILSHANHQGLLSSRVFVFHLAPVTPDGEVHDPFEDGVPVKYIFFSNQPVATQVESAIVTMSKLVARQAHIARIKAGHADISDIDLRMVELDDVAQNQVIDVLRYGWHAAAEMVARQAEAARFALNVTYSPAAAPTREDVSLRIAALRRCYNLLPTAKEAVDRFVSAIAPRWQIVAPPEVPEAVRASTQQHFALGALNHHLAETLRNAFVVGNGYLAFNTAPPFPVYNLRPEDAVDQGNGTAAPLHGRPAVHALHLRGLEQPGSVYGLGALELALPYLQQLDVFVEAATFARKILATPSQANKHDRANQYLELAERTKASAQEMLRQVYAPIFQFLPDPAPNLYFEGRDKL
jgi:hypothetical protein